jgi:hypothetical protein
MRSSVDYADQTMNITEVVIGVTLRDATKSGSSEKQVFRNKDRKVQYSKRYAHGMQTVCTAWFR